MSKQTATTRVLTVSVPQLDHFTEHWWKQIRPKTDNQPTLWSVLLLNPNLTDFWNNNYIQATILFMRLSIGQTAVSRFLKIVHRMVVLSITRPWQIYLTFYWIAEFQSMWGEIDTNFRSRHGGPRSPSAHAWPFAHPPIDTSGNFPARLCRVIF